MPPPANHPECDERERSPDREKESCNQAIRSEKNKGSKNGLHKAYRAPAREDNIPQETKEKKRGDDRRAAKAASTQARTHPVILDGRQ